MSDNAPKGKLPPKPFTLEEGRRQVRSFVLRQGRFTGTRLHDRVAFVVEPFRHHSPQLILVIDQEDICL